MKDGSELGIAGVRLANGRQVFVEGVPPNLAHGRRVVIRSAGQDLEGTVSVAPRLIVWRDPEAILGTFVRIMPAESTDPSSAAAPPLALFMANEDAPEPARLNDMLHLARAETFRLDD